MAEDVSSVELILPIKVTVEIGEDSHPLVIKAVVDLIAAITTVGYPAMIEQNSNAYVGHAQLVDFIQQKHPKSTPVQVARLADHAVYGLVINLNRKLLIKCQICQQRYGDCRCPSAGWRVDQDRWIYKRGARSWQISIDSLMALPESDIAKLAPTIARRVSAFISSLSNTQ